MAKLTLFLLAFFCTSTLVMGQSGAFGFKNLEQSQKERVSTYYLPNQEKFRQGILKNNWKITAENKNWIYFSTTANDLDKAFKSGDIPDYFIKYTVPRALNDTMREHHRVNMVHNGIGLTSAYKGKDVVIGLVDTGIETDHPDFIDANGKTRILRLWDQSTDSSSNISPYGYGLIWDSTHINSNYVNGNDNGGHGSTVAGAAAGNGRATGYNQGVAPEADIIMVKTDFNLPNWHITVAEACDYIFKVADSLGKPAVVNLSVGDYMGSHDGTDPASAYIDSLLDAKNGRIVVAACGNSGNWGNYHCQGHPNIDTTLVWFKNNPSSAFGANKIFFDLYSDLSDATYSYSFKAVHPTTFATSATTIYRPALGSMGTPIYDTLRNSNGQRLATIEIYTEQEANNLHMQVLFTNVDSTSYNFGFYTIGSGKYDLWSGTGLGFNEIVQTLPSPLVLPGIVDYQLPDAHQTLISNWICSPKVVSVGNIQNRSRYLTKAGSYYVPSGGSPVGKLSINSSKGPTRHNILKPDIVASGDVMLAPGPLWYLTNPANDTRIDTGDWHMGNGGTSMASPVVAGIAALYLERCKKGNNLAFLDILRNHSNSNAYSGTLPNNAYGNGIIDAYNVIVNQEFTANVVGDAVICEGPDTVSIQTTATIGSVEWNTGATTPILYQYMPGDVYATVYNENGCGVSTDTLSITMSSTETINPIVVSGNFTILSTSSSNQTYQWTLNGTDISGATNDTLIIGTNQNGVYDCYATSNDGCKVYAGSVTINLGIHPLSSQPIVVYPNPVQTKLFIQTQAELVRVRVIDVTGKEIAVNRDENSINVAHLSDGYYQLLIETTIGNYQTKFIKNK